MTLYHPENIDELIENAKVSIGQGVIEINTSEAQDVLAAQKAIDLYCDYHYDATERVFIAQEVTQLDIQNNYISTPKNVWNVIRILGASSFPNIYGSNMGCLCCDQGGGYTVTQYGLGSNITSLRSMVGQSAALTTYYLAAHHSAFFQKIMYPNIPMDWNRGSKRIRFLGNISQATNCGKGFVVYEAKVVNENLCFDCDNPEGQGSCFYDNQWLKDYTAAQISKTWGLNMKKFESIQIASGFTFNGQTIYDEAITEIEKLEEQLFDRYSIPAMMITG